MTPAEKFNASLEASPYTPAQFSRLMGVEPQTITNWKNRGVAAKHLFQAAQYLGEDPQWLMLDDKDLPEGFIPEQVDREDQAVAMFESLTDSQKSLVEGLLLEFVKAPPSNP